MIKECENLKESVHKLKKIQENMIKNCNIVSGITLGLTIIGCIALAAGAVVACPVTIGVSLVAIGIVSGITYFQYKKGQKLTKLAD